MGIPVVPVQLNVLSVETRLKPPRVMADALMVEIVLNSACPLPFMPGTRNRESAPGREI